LKLLDFLDTQVRAVFDKNRTFHCEFSTHNQLINLLNESLVWRNDLLALHNRVLHYAHTLDLETRAIFTFYGIKTLLPFTTPFHAILNSKLPQFRVVNFYAYLNKQLIGSRSRV
jgi:hypothetical protein